MIYRKKEKAYSMGDHRERVKFVFFKKVEKQVNGERITTYYFLDKVRIKEEYTFCGN